MEEIITNIEEEITNTYLTYAINIITDRAIPDARDGLKPVHRRILYAMTKINKLNTYKKSARVVGEVIGKYHPHGDMAVYETIIKMTQPFLIRYPLIKGQGNFGSIDGDQAAAMRYTEIKLTNIAQKMLLNLKNKTVPFEKNYDNTCKIPTILPTQIPNLLINGTSGIAVGITTTFMPHNLCEISNGIIAILDNEEITIENLLTFIQGPDFPTGGIVYKNTLMQNIYLTGKGSICIYSKYHYLTKKKSHNSIIITEIPYQITKSSIMNNIQNLIKTKKIQGIINIKDESNKNKIQINIKCEKNCNLQLIINDLFSKTLLKTTLQISTIALVNNKPKVLNLKDLLNQFINHRINIITKSTIFFINKIKEKIFFFTGFLITLYNIKSILNIIKNHNKNINELKNILLKKLFIIPPILFNEDYELYYYKCKKNLQKCKLTKTQINSIIEIKITNLTKIEKTKVIEQLNKYKEKIKQYKELLKHKEKIKELIRNDIIKLKNDFGDKRKTSILEVVISNKTEEIETGNNTILLPVSSSIIKKKILIFLLEKNYLLLNILKTNYNNKKLLFNNNKCQQFYIGSTHSKLLIFTNTGNMYILNLLLSLKENTIKINKKINLEKIIKFKNSDEKIQKILIDNKKNLNNSLLIITKNNYIKKLYIEELIKKKSNKIIKLMKNDELIDVNFLNENDKYIILITQNNKAIKILNKKIKYSFSFCLTHKKIIVNDTILTAFSITINEYFLLIKNNNINLINEKFIKRIKGKNYINTKFSLSKNLSNEKILTIKKITDEDKEILCITLNNYLKKISIDSIKKNHKNIKEIIYTKNYQQFLCDTL